MVSSTASQPQPLLLSSNRWRLPFGMAMNRLRSSRSNWSQIEYGQSSIFLWSTYPPAGWGKSPAFDRWLLGTKNQYDRACHARTKSNLPRCHFVRRWFQSWAVMILSHYARSMKGYHRRVAFPKGVFVGIIISKARRKFSIALVHIARRNFVWLHPRIPSRHEPIAKFQKLKIRKEANSFVPIRDATNEVIWFQLVFGHWLQSRFRCDIWYHELLK